MSRATRRYTKPYAMPWSEWNDLRRSRLRWFFYRFWYSH